MKDDAQLLRTRIEATYGKPATLVITAATAGDGTAVTTERLARSLGAAGHQTVTILASGETSAGRRTDRSVDLRHLTQETLRGVLRSRLDGLVSLDMADDFTSATTSLESVKHLLGLLNEAFDFIIVDVGCLLENGVGLLFADVCDGLIINFLAGRAPTSDDAAFKRLIGELEASVFGVVTVTRSELLRRPFVPAAAQKKPVPAVVDVDLDENPSILRGA